MLTADRYVHISGLYVHIKAIVILPNCTNRTCHQCPSRSQLLPDNYALACGWCDYANACTSLKDCPCFLDCKAVFHTTTCPKAKLIPKILSFSPEQAPLRGGVTLKIFGENLNFISGKSQVFVGLRNKHNVAIKGHHLNCTINETASSPTMIVCKFQDEYSKSTFSLESYIIFKPDANDSFAVTSNNKFYFFDSNNFIRDFSPKTGPASGGTIISIIGYGLDSIDSSRLTIGDPVNEINCEILFRNHSFISCKTAPAKSNYEGLLNLFVAGNTTLSRTPYVYE